MDAEKNGTESLNTVVAIENRYNSVFCNVIYSPIFLRKF